MNPEDDSAQESTISRGFFRMSGGIVKLLKGLAIAILVLGFAGITDVGAHLFFGWVDHLRENVPRLLGKWPELVLPLVCLGIATVLAHRFMVWLAASRAGQWKISQSLGVVGLLLLCSAAAIAMSGITHQMAWLSKEPLHERRGMDRQLADARRVVQNLLMALLEFQTEHDRFPESMAELLDSDPGLKGMDRVAPVEGRSSEPVIYLKPSSDSFPQEKQAVFISPFMPRSLSVMVGYSDLSTERQAIGEGGDVLEKLKGHGN